MTPNLVDAVNAHVSTDAVGAIAREVGASAGEVTTTVKNSTPSIFAGFIRSASTEAGATRLLAAATEAHGSGLLSKLSSFGARDAKDLGTRSEPMLNALFGDRTNMVVGAVSQTSAVRPDIAARVLATLAPIALAVLGKEAVTRRLGPQGLSQLLLSQKRDVMDSAPRGLGDVLGLGREPALASESVSVSETPALRTAAAAAHRPTIPWGLIGAVAAGLVVIGLLWSNLRKPDVSMKSPTVDEPVVRAPTLNPPPIPHPDLGKPATPPGPTATAPDESTMNDHPSGAGMPGMTTAPEATNPPEPTTSAPAEPTSETTTTSADMNPTDWSSYDVHFQFATSQLGGDDTDNVKKLADAMKANPDARIKLSGHTDSVGEADANQRLALERAAVVKQKLVDQGIDASRIDVTAIGAERAVASNGTAAGRAQNRRVEVSLIANDKKKK